MEHYYKAHSILISTWGRLDPDGFRPELRISRKAPVIFKAFKLNQTFSSREAAEGYGLEVAKRWIDESKLDRKEGFAQDLKSH